MTHDDVGLSELAAIHLAELRAAEAHCLDGFDTYWAVSASASVIRDYASGRVVNLTRRHARWR